MKLVMRLSCLILALAFATFGLAQNQDSPGDEDAARSLERAQQYYREQSYRLARNLYQQALKTLDPGDPRYREVAFYAADTLWRGGEPDQYEQARESLEAMASQPPYDEWWARANASLADFFTQTDLWTHRVEIEQYYLAAIQYWKHSTNVAEGLPHFLSLSQSLIDSLQQFYSWQPYPGSFEITDEPPYLRPRPAQENNEQLPFDRDLLGQLMQDMLEAAKTDADKAKASLQLARRMLTLNRGPRNLGQQAIALLQSIFTQYSGTEYYDDALMAAAEYYQQDEQYVQAAETLRALTSTFRPMQTPFYQQARDMLDYITSPQVSIDSNAAVPPGAFVEVNLNYRNLTALSYELWRVDPAAAAEELVQHNLQPPSSRVKALGERIKTWEEPNIQADKEYIPHNQKITIDPPAPGLYYLIAESTPGASERRSNALAAFVVTDLAMVSKSGNSESYFFVTNAQNGLPVPAAEVHVIVTANPRSRQQRLPVIVSNTTLTADADGLAKIPTPQPNTNIHAIAVSEGSAAFVNFSYWTRGRREPRTDLYAYADRPAYRPGDTVNFKALVRRYDGSDYQIPRAQDYLIQIRSQRGDLIHSARLRTSEYGTLHGQLELASDVQLGIYSLELLQVQPQQHLASTAVFRVEEYKLPEFKVDVSTSQAAYRLGDTVPVTIHAEYYFGGPVPSAVVEVVVRRRPYYTRPPWFYPYPWYYDSMMTRPRYPRGEGGEIVKEVAAVTDEDGNAEIMIDTPATGDNGYSYTIEARVTDASRREIRASRDIHVTRQEYFVFMRPGFRLYHPDDRVEVQIETKNASDDPVSQRGTVTIYRLLTPEEPIIPYLSEEELEKRYNKVEMASGEVITNDRGEGEYRYEATESGYYEAKWESKDKYGTAIESSNKFWVLETGTADIGYRYAGIEIASGKESYSIGDNIQLILSSFLPESAVLLSLEGDDIYDLQVVRMNGPVKLVEIPARTDHQPNAFAHAVLCADYRAYFDDQEIIVPPEDKFLQVEVESPDEEFQPGEEGTFIIRTKDQAGDPVQAEVSIGVADAAVYYIQEELAGDIRQHYYGERRWNQVNTTTSHSRFPFRHEIIEDRLEKEEAFYDTAGYGGGSMLAARGRAVPSAAPMMEMAAADGMIAMGGEMANELVEPDVRTDFRATMFWAPTVVTDEDGVATVSVIYPDRLTEWRATARAITAQTQIGEATASTRTKKDVLVRLQAPRFFVQGDQCIVSANVHNYTDQALDVVVDIKADGLSILEDASEILNTDAGTEENVIATTPQITISIPAGAERRVDWYVHAEDATEETKILVSARTSVASDAMEKIYPILEHGIEKFIAESTKLSGQTAQSTTILLNVPSDRKPEADHLVIRVTPSMAAMLVDCLDYLAQYPYGCTEQTVSRFIPAVIVASTLQELGIDKPVLENRLPEMISAGLKRLQDFQHRDGGWAWWKEGDSDPYMTAYVLYALILGQQADANIPPGMIERAAQFLTNTAVRYEDNPDMLVWCLHPLSYLPQFPNELRGLLDRAWDQRDDLSAYSRALLLLIHHNLGDAEKAQILVDNIRNGMVYDEDTDTVHWGQKGVYFHWRQGAVESTAFTLKALLAADPENDLTEPAMLWLVRNRRANRWDSTKDTAIAIYALSDYILASEEAEANFTAVIRVNGQSVAEIPFNPDNIFTQNGIVSVPPALLQSGENSVEITKNGTGSLYASAYLTYYTLEDFITSAGNEVFVQREYFKIVDEATVGGEFTRTRIPVNSGDAFEQGDRVEVVLNIEAKNNLEYLVFRDMKAAGLEPVDLQSGYTWKDGLSTFREFRDEETLFFVYNMQQGKHKIAYELVAEIPGRYSALPTQGYAMYVPEIRGNSDEYKAVITEE